MQKREFYKKPLAIAMWDFLLNRAKHYIKKKVKNFKPDFTLYNACKTTNEKFREHGLHSDVYVVFNVECGRLACKVIFFE